MNTLSPGDQVLMFETGQFATLWREMAIKLGLEVHLVPGDWRHGVDAQTVERSWLKTDRIASEAIAMVHNETSTGVTSSVASVRKAMDRCGHSALLLVIRFRRSPRSTTGTTNGALT